MESFEEALMLYMLKKGVNRSEALHFVNLIKKKCKEEKLVIGWSSAIASKKLQVRYKKMMIVARKTILEFIDSTCPKIWYRKEFL